MSFSIRADEQRKEGQPALGFPLRETQPDDAHAAADPVQQRAGRMHGHIGVARREPRKHLTETTKRDED